MKPVKRVYTSASLNPHLLGAIWGACKLPTQQDGGASACELGKAAHRRSNLACDQCLKAGKAASVVDFQESKGARASGTACADPATDGDVAAGL